MAIIEPCFPIWLFCSWPRQLAGLIDVCSELVRRGCIFKYAEDVWIQPCSYHKMWHGKMMFMILWSFFDYLRLRTWEVELIGFWSNTTNCWCCCLLMFVAGCREPKSAGRGHERSSSWKPDRAHLHFHLQIDHESVRNRWSSGQKSCKWFQNRRFNDLTPFNVCCTLRVHRVASVMVCDGGNPTGKGVDSDADRQCWRKSSRIFAEIEVPEQDPLAVPGYAFGAVLGLYSYFHWTRAL